MMYTCPVCFFNQLEEPPRPYNICDCCGTEFGVDDEELSHEELRAQWVASGANWFFKLPPIGWNAEIQLRAASAHISHP